MGPKLLAIKNGLTSIGVSNLRELKSESALKLILNAGPMSIIHFENYSELARVVQDASIVRGYKVAKIIYSISDVQSLLNTFRAKVGNSENQNFQNTFVEPTDDQVARADILASYTGASSQDPNLFPLSKKEDHQITMEKYIESGKIISSYSKTGNLESILVTGPIDFGAVSGQLIAWIWINKSVPQNIQVATKCAWVSWMKERLSGPVYASIRLDNIPSIKFHTKIGFKPTCLILQKNG